MKELDILLEAFLEKNHDLLIEGAMPELERFLDQEDDRIWDWLQQLSVPSDPEFRALVSLIRGGA